MHWKIDNCLERNLMPKLTVSKRCLIWPIEKTTWVMVEYNKNEGGI